jgi:DNA-binding transcriptional ArsR family regulator
MIPERREFGAKMFSALANPARLQILEHLADGPASVNDIAEAVGLKQSMTSQHLSSLLAAGVVVYERNGNSRLYSLRGPRVARILELLEEFHTVHLENLRNLLTQHYESGVVAVK